MQVIIVDCIVIKSKIAHAIIGSTKKKEILFCLLRKKIYNFIRNFNPILHKACPMPIQESGNHSKFYIEQVVFKNIKYIDGQSREVAERIFWI